MALVCDEHWLKLTGRERIGEKRKSREITEDRKECRGGFEDTKETDYGKARVLGKGGKLSSW